MEEKKTIDVDPMAIGFAVAMEKLTYIGLAVMLLSGILYLFGVNAFLDPKVVAAHWGEPATEFWAGTSNMSIDGYSWFLSHLGNMDMLCIGGVALLGLVPLFSILLALFRAQGVYRILMLVLLCEFAFAIVKPLIMAGGGE